MLDDRTILLCALNPRPIVITGPGRYRTRLGETVTVGSVDRSYPPPVFAAEGSYEGGPNECWHLSGRVLAFSESWNDIVGPA